MTPIKKKFETDRLVLKVLERRDAPLVQSFYERNLFDFGKYEPLPATEVHTLAFHERCMDYESDAFKQGKLVRFFIFTKDNPMQIIGTVSYRNIRQAFYGCCEVGYKIDMAYRRRGYAHEAIGFANSLMQKSYSLHRIEALVMTDNTASISLLEGLGFQREGLLRDKLCLKGTWYDHYMYSKIFND